MSSKKRPEKLLKWTQVIFSPQLRWPSTEQFDPVACSCQLGKKNPQRPSGTYDSSNPTLGFWFRKATDAHTQHKWPGRPGDTESFVYWGLVFKLLGDWVALEMNHFRWVGSTEWRKGFGISFECQCPLATVRRGWAHLSPTRMEADYIEKLPNSLIIRTAWGGERGSG